MGLPRSDGQGDDSFDASNADWLRLVLEAARRGHGTFVVDMTGTRYCDLAGVEVLVRAHTRALADGGELRLVRPATAVVLLMFACSGIDQVIPNVTAVAGALQPAPAASRPRQRRVPQPGMRAHGGSPRPAWGTGAAGSHESTRALRNRARAAAGTTSRQPGAPIQATALACRGTFAGAPARDEWIVIPRD